MLYASLTQYRILAFLLFTSLSLQGMICPAPSPRFATPYFQDCIAALHPLLSEGIEENFEWAFRWRPEPRGIGNPLPPSQRESNGRYCGKAWSGGECFYSRMNYICGARNHNVELLSYIQHVLCFIRYFFPYLLS